MTGPLPDGSSTVDGSPTFDLSPSTDDPTASSGRGSVCVVCGAQTELDGCCSIECAQRAEREIKRNAALLQRTGAGPTGEDRQRLAARNGRMLSALLRWRASNSTVSSDGERSLSDVDARRPSAP